ncbi:MAG: hypothetical protein ACK5Q5_03570 [Planctomycetaceae bacterium]
MRWTLGFAFSLLLATVALAEGPLGAFPPEQEPILPQEQPVPAEEMSIVVYPVADLVLTAGPLEVHPGPPRVEASPTPGTNASITPHVASPLEMMAELSVILQSVVAPTSWEMAGGAGHVSVHGPTQSLVVRQSAAGHQAIDDLLSNLRRSREVEIALSVQVLTPKSPDEHAAGSTLLEAALDGYTEPITADEMIQLLDGMHSSEIVRNIRRVQLANGGPAVVFSVIHCTAAATADRRAVYVDLWIDPTGINDEPPPAASLGRYRIPDGKTVMVPWHNQHGEMHLILATARILIPDEEEELLPTPIAPTAALEVAPDLHPLPLRPLPVVPSDDSRPLLAVAYPVSDLITPLVAHLPAEKVDWSRELDQFGQMLSRKTGAACWQSGETIGCHTATKSLVIRQTSRVHAQVAEFLTELRESLRRSAPQMLDNGTSDLASSEALAAPSGSPGEPEIVQTSLQVQQQQPSDRFVIHVYPVSDLLTTAAGRSPIPVKNWEFELNRFAARVARGCGGKWSGGASITGHPGTLSLVVRQTEAMQRQLADYLASQRRAEDSAVVVTVCSLVEKSTTPQLLASVLAPDDAKEVLQRAELTGTAQELTLSGSSPTSQVIVPGLPSISAVPAIDGSQVLMEVLADSKVLVQQAVPVGSSLVIRPGENQSDRTWIVTVNRIAEVEKIEAELLAIPAAD